MQQDFVRFEGNCPRNVSKDAKYSIRYDDGNYVVGVVYRTAFGEDWRPVTENHPVLVEMVNAVKIAFSSMAGGSFYINEYKQVIVPISNRRDYYLAGEYIEPLAFKFEGHYLSGDAQDLEGQPILPGDDWVGPHPGIPYVLKAGAGDITYRSEPRPRVTVEVALSDFHDSATVRQICDQIASVKGHQGGRFYINEYQHLFAPVSGVDGLEYVYIGQLDSLDDWFPKPHSGLATGSVIPIRREITQMAKAVGNRALTQRALLELLAVKSVMSSRGVELDEALDILVQELAIQLILVDPEQQELKEQLAPQVAAWDLPETLERIEAASDVLDVLAFREGGIDNYPEWLATSIGPIAEQSYPVLFLNFGASLMPIQLLATLNQPEFTILEGNEQAVESARLLLALSNIDLDQIAVSVRLFAAADEDNDILSDLGYNAFGAVYVNLLGHFNQPRLRKRLAGELPNFLADQLSPNGRAMILAFSNVLNSMASRDLRKQLLTHLHLESVLTLPQLIWSDAAFSTALIILKRPKEPIAHRWTVMAPAPDSEVDEPLITETLVRGFASWVNNESESKAERLPLNSAYFFALPSSQIAERWDPKFNSIGRRALQDTLIEDPYVNWLEAVTGLISRGSPPNTFQPYMEARLVGVSFDKRQESITGLQIGDGVWLYRKPDNPHDPNAIHVERSSGTSLGYLPAELAEEIFEESDPNLERYPATVVKIHGGTEDRPLYGVTIRFAPPQLADKGEAVTLIRPLDITNSQLIGLGEPVWLPKSSLDRVVHLDAGDILLNLDNYSQACVVTSSFSHAVCYKSLAIIRPVNDVDSLYLLSFILGSFFQQQLDYVATDIRGRRVAMADLKDLLVIVPPIADQRRIAWAFAESQGELGTDRSSGIEKSLQLAQDDSRFNREWLFHTTLSNLFSDQEQIHSLDDWLSLKGDFVKQLGNTIYEGKVAFKDAEINEVIRFLDIVREKLRRQLLDSDSTNINIQQTNKAVVQLRYKVESVEDSLIRLRFHELINQLSKLLSEKREPAPVVIYLNTKNLKQNRPDQLTMVIRNVSDKPLYALEISPTFLGCEILDNTYWRIDQINPNETHVLITKVLCKQSESVQITGEVSYVMGDVTEIQVMPRFELKVIPVEQLPFVEIRPNPYITGLPVEQPEMFFGREDVMAFLRDNLIGTHQKNIIILQGNRRTGKTSILKQIVIRDWFFPDIPVYIDCQGLGKLTNQSFFYKVARQIQRTLKKRNDVPKPPAMEKGDISDEDPFYDFRELLDDLIPEGRNIILLIDEFELIDKAIREGKLDSLVLENLRHLLQHHGAVGAIFTGSYRLSKLREEYWSILYGLGLKQHIGFLDKEAAVQLIKQPVQDQVSYAADAVERILQLTSGHPLLLQIMCHNVVGQLNELETNFVTQQIVEDAAQKTLISAGDQIRYMFDTAGSPATQAVLVFMAQELSHPDETLLLQKIEVFSKEYKLPLTAAALVDALREMSEKDVIRISRSNDINQYGFKIDLVRQWLRRNQDLRSIIERAK